MNIDAGNAGKLKAEILYSKVLEYAESVSKGQCCAPPWVGEFWNDVFAAASTKIVVEKDRRYTVDEIENRISMSDGMLVMKINSFPTNRILQDGLALRPEANELLAKWKLIWDQSFPGWEDDSDWETQKSETSNRDWALDRLRHDTRKLGGADVEKIDMLAGFFLNHEHTFQYLADDHRDFRLHIIDDATTILSLASATPGSVFIVHHYGWVFGLKGHDEGGLPVLERIEHPASWIKKRLEDHPKYWQWPEFQKHLGRRSITAGTHSIAGALVADMAQQGHTHAFIKSTASKSGTWTVNLNDVNSIRDGITKILPMCSVSWRPSIAAAPLIIQEHLPFTHEQRFFVIDGKIVASVCSDRNFCELDNFKGRKLDERIAVLERPEIDQGEYDRGRTSFVRDRSLAAKFARKARQIVRELKSADRIDYVLDMGLTARGVCAVEINTVHYAGPYSLEKVLLVKAFEKKRARTDGFLSELVTKTDRR